MALFQVVVSVALHVEAKTEKAARDWALNVVETLVPDSKSTEVECSERIKQ